MPIFATVNNSRHWEMLYHLLLIQYFGIKASLQRCKLAFVFYSTYVLNKHRSAARPLSLADAIRVRHIEQRQLTVDGSIEGNDRLAARKAERLQLVVYDLQEVMVVDSVYLDKHIHAACSVMALHYLRYLLQFFYNMVKLLGVLEVKSYIRTRLVTYLFRVYQKLRPLDNTQIGQLGHTLVDSCPTHITHPRNLQKRDTGILCDKLQYLLV